LFENMKWGFYMVYMVPMLGAIAAVAAGELAGRFPRLIRAVLVILVAMMATRTLLRIRANPYKQSYQPVVDFLEANAANGALIMGGADLVFGYGIRANLIDDIRLGYYSGKQPDL